MASVFRCSHLNRALSAISVGNQIKANMSMLDKSNFNVYSQTNINYQQSEPIDNPNNSEKALKHLFKISLESLNFECSLSKGLSVSISMSIRS